MQVTIASLLRVVGHRRPREDADEEKASGKDSHRSPSSSKELPIAAGRTIEAEFLPHLNGPLGSGTCRPSCQTDSNSWVASLPCMRGISVQVRSAPAPVASAAADNAAAGKVGEFITSNIASASSVSMPNNTTTDITSISLTAGDWDVYANVYFAITVSQAQELQWWINTTSATAPDNSFISSLYDNTAVFNSNGGMAPYRRINVSTTTTIYLTGFVLTGGTVTACGNLSARRVR